MSASDPATQNIDLAQAPPAAPRTLRTVYYKTLLNLEPNAPRKEAIQHTLSLMVKVTAAISMGLLINNMLPESLKLPQLSNPRAARSYLGVPPPTLPPTRDLPANMALIQGPTALYMTLYYLVVLYGVSQLTQLAGGAIEKYLSTFRPKVARDRPAHETLCTDALLALFSPRTWYNLKDSSDDTPLRCCGWQGILFILSNAPAALLLASLLYFGMTQSGIQTERYAYQPGGVPKIIYENARLLPVSQMADICYRITKGMGVIGFYALLGALSQLSKTAPCLMQIRAILDKMYSAIYDKITARFAQNGERQALLGATANHNATATAIAPGSAARGTTTAVHNQAAAHDPHASNA